MTIHTHLKGYQRRVNRALTRLLPSTNQQPIVLHKAMRYSVLNGGKRIRAALLYATGESLGANPAILDHLSAAIEMIHAFSLIHDDLPALDNDDLRRGKPSCHKAFGEATAILAGDALHTAAFEIVANLNQQKIKPKMIVEILKVVSHAVLQLERGEELDIRMEGKKVSLAQLQKTYSLKTGYLLTASIMIGALAANCQRKECLMNLKKFGDYLGLAFQIHDDVIGMESSTQELGKPKGSDILREKPTYPSLLGLELAKEKERQAYTNALTYLAKAGIKKEKLASLAEYVIQRRF